jgi:uncharacterized protein (DUF58 family)
MPHLIRQKLRRWIRQRLIHWLAHRQPAVPALTLQHKFLLVFPTTYGFAYVGLLLLLYILGTNYQNNLILLLSYLLLSLLLVSMVLCYQNLAGLVLKAGPAATAFAGQPLYLTLELQNWRQRQSLQFCLTDWQCQQQQGVLHLEYIPQQRGLYQLPRLKLSSVHPFGLIRCWCYLALQQDFWVYPAPLPNPENKLTAQTAGDQIWSHLAPYQPGDKLQRIDWKKLARQPEQFVVKVYQTTEPNFEVRQLVLPAFTGQALEIQLQLLTQQILDFTAAGLCYSLQLPDRLIAADTGPAHQHRCLQALALC